MAMEYAQLRQQAQDGDVLLVEGKALISRFIRAFSGESISHVAMLFWIGTGLFVAEFIEGDDTPYNIVPASQWFDQYKGIQVLFGMAPAMVRGKAGVMATVEQFRATKKPKYGWWTFPVILLAQWTNKDYKVGGKVCSTFVEAAWSACGYKFSRTPDPGDYIAMCQLTMPVSTSPVQP
jgi:hypothetical protein